MPVGVGDCAVGPQFRVPRAHGYEVAPDDDGTTSCDGNVGASRENGNAWTVEELDVSCEKMQAWVAGRVREQDNVLHDVVKRVREQRERVRELSDRGRRCLRLVNTSWWLG